MPSRKFIGYLSQDARKFDRQCGIDRATTLSKSYKCDVHWTKVYCPHFEEIGFVFSLKPVDPIEALNYLQRELEKEFG